MNRASLLIVIPQHQELTALIDGMRSFGQPLEPLRIGRSEVFWAPGLDAVLAIAGHGKTQFGVQTQYLIDRCPEFRLVLCAGAAGALASELRPGDIVVGTATVEHDYRLRFIKAPLPTWEADSVVLADLRTTIANLPALPVHFGAVASGDEDVVDGARAVELRRETGALCVAWEGAGGARAARFSGLGFVEVRGITDAADADARRSYAQTLRPVMGRIGELLVAWRGSAVA